MKAASRNFEMEKYGARADFSFRSIGSQLGHYAAIDAMHDVSLQCYRETRMTKILISAMNSRRHMTLSPHSAVKISFTVPSPATGYTAS